jgi:hypothetical protein
MTFKPESIERIAKRFQPGEIVDGRSFVVLVNGERIFLGGLWSLFSSSGSLPVPTLIFEPAAPGHRSNSRMLYPAPRSSSPTWSDPRITAALSHASSEGDQETEAPNQPVEATQPRPEISHDQ